MTDAIIKVESQIEEVSFTISELERVAGTDGSGLNDFQIGKLISLRKKEEDLRKKEEDLRKEKLILLELSKSSAPKSTGKSY